MSGLWVWSAVASENNGGGKFCKELIGTGSDFSKKLKSKCVGFGFTAAVAAETNGRGKLGKEIVGTSNSISKKLGSEGTMEDKSNERLPMMSLKQSLSIEIEGYGCVKEVTRRPETVSSVGWLIFGILSLYKMPKFFVCLSQLME